MVKRRDHRIVRGWRRGGATLEYLMILTFIVLPLGLLLPLYVNMIKLYASRLYVIFRVPF